MFTRWCYFPEQEGNMYRKKIYRQKLDHLTEFNEVGELKQLLFETTKNSLGMNFGRKKNSFTTH